jgi:hypothetical protein
MKPSDLTPSPQPFELDLDDLLHPAQAFADPRDVVHDPDLIVNEKRAILASWASDACAVEAAPTLRCTLGVAARSRSTRSSKRYARSTRRRTTPAVPDAQDASCDAGLGDVPGAFARVPSRVRETTCHADDPNAARSPASQI